MSAPIVLKPTKPVDMAELMGKELSSLMDERARYRMALEAIKTYIESFTTDPHRSTIWQTASKALEKKP